MFNLLFHHRRNKTLSWTVVNSEMSTLQRRNIAIHVWMIYWNIFEYALSRSANRKWISEFITKGNRARWCIWFISRSLSIKVCNILDPSLFIHSALYSHDTQKKPPRISCRVISNILYPIASFTIPRRSVGYITLNVHILCALSEQKLIKQHHLRWLGTSNNTI